MTWNEYPVFVRNSFLKRLKPKKILFQMNEKKERSTRLDISR